MYGPAVVAWYVAGMLLCVPSSSALSSFQTTPAPHYNDPALQCDPAQPPPIVYTIAGSDSGGGAGIQADLHAIHAMGGHGCSAITCLTAQNSVGVTDIHTPPVSFLQAQLQALQNDLSPMAIKIGMLHTRELAMAVGLYLKELRANDNKVWVVLDPVMISTSGHRLIQHDTQEAMITHVFPHVDVLTPNKHETEALLDCRLETLDDVEAAAAQLLQLMGRGGDGASNHAQSVLIKGGHAVNDAPDDWALDYVLSSSSSASNAAAATAVTTEKPRLCDGHRGVWLQTPKMASVHTHGTGCTLSSALATALALGERERQQPAGRRRGYWSCLTVVDASVLAKAYVTAGIAHGPGALGQGPGPVGQTSFPSNAEFFPRIVARPFYNHPGFVKMHAATKIGGTKDVPRFGTVYPVVDSEDWMQRICQTGGIQDVQLRIKNMTSMDDIFELVRRCQTICRKHGVRLWINDYWPAAVAAQCFGVHMGQEDLLTCQAHGGLQQLQEYGIALGLSTHSFGELAAALGVCPSYISLGPVFATSSKTLPFEPQGLTAVRKWRQLVPSSIPLIVIGGIGTADSVAQVSAAGADSVAVIGAVTQAPDTKHAVSALQAAMNVEDCMDLKISLQQSDACV